MSDKAPAPYEAEKAQNQVRITLPDGSERTYEGAVTGLDLASDIGPGLAKAALAWKVDGDIWDLLRPLSRDAAVSILTLKDEADALELIRHDCAHLMAMAVQELFPGTQATIGPVIEDGFFYDFARNEPFHLEDLEKIEAKMKELVDANHPTTREVWDRDEAVKHFEEMGETYKAEIIGDLPEGEDVSIYYHGPWHDLCRGPHLASLGKIGKAFKLTKLAGAYWRGDAKNAQLQRIYGTAWRDPKDLKAYLHRLEEAEKRDHRRLGKEMDLFHMQEEAQGMVFWHAKGWSLYRELENYVRRKIDRAGYEEVKTPQLVDRKLWENSGHWDKYREHMFISEADDKTLAFKPMNCPCHVQIFNQGLKSYRDLPLRMAEFGSCHRYEPSGALHGLMRVRGFVQDDAHIFCTEEQIADETAAIFSLLKEMYSELGFDDVMIMFSDRPEVRAGDDATWDRAEAALRDAAEKVGVNYTLNSGDGAFYGPKLDFVLKDAIGREWQCGTFQVDFIVPERLGAVYIGEDGNKHTPVMLHRAILGSFERFIGVLTEHYAGRFPLWLAPTQVVVAPITSEADAFAEEILASLKKLGIRAEADLRNEKINFKVREHSLAKVPVMMIVGKKEMADRSVSIRRLGSKDQESLDLEAAIHNLKIEATAPDLK
jgi:threonyl-tRNA synthetase